jgi:hypothetical protein
VASAEKPEKPFAIHHSWTVALIGAVVMVVLALVGVALSTTSSAFASTYWVALVPVFGGLCVGTAWLRGQEQGHLDRALAIRQVLHWLGVAIALGLDYYILRTGEETGVAAGMNALLVLALGCYLAGVHLEWLFTLVGVLLTLALIVVSKAEQYLWLIFVAGAATIALLFVLHRLLAPGHSRKSPSGSSPPSLPAKA